MATPIHSATHGPTHGPTHAATDSITTETVLGSGETAADPIAMNIASDDPSLGVTLSVLLATAVISGFLGATCARYIRAYRTPFARLGRALKERFPEARVAHTLRLPDPNPDPDREILLHTHDRTIRVRAPRLAAIAPLGEARVQTEISRVLAQAVRASRWRPILSGPIQEPATRASKGGTTRADVDTTSADTVAGAGDSAVDPVADLMKHLLPVLLPRVRTEVDGGVGRFTLPIGAQLDIAFARAPAGNNVWLTVDDAQALGFDTTHLLQHALTYLRTQEVVISKEHSGHWEVYSVKPADGIESSRLLLAEVWERVSEHAGAPLVLCAPSMDRLYAAPADRPDSIARMMRYAAADWANRTHVVSTTLWTWEDGKLEPWTLHA